MLSTHKNIRHRRWGILPRELKERIWRLLPPYVRVSVREWGGHRYVYTYSPTTKAVCARKVASIALNDKHVLGAYASECIIGGVYSSFMMSLIYSRYTREWREEGWELVGQHPWPSRYIRGLAVNASLFVG